MELKDFNQKEILATLSNNELTALLSPICPPQTAQKIIAVKRGITFGELEETIKKFPVIRKSQVLRLFEKEACVNKKDNISGGRITREVLLEIVYALENYTGKKLTRDCNAPLRYLEDACEKLAQVKQNGPKSSNEKITIGDFADYFSGRCGKIDLLIALAEKVKASRETVKSYLADSCGISLEEVNEQAPITSLVPNIGECGNQSHFVVIYWLESFFDKEFDNSLIENHTVGDLIDFFAE